MYDIKPLEEEWKRYKQKKRKPWYLLFVSLVTVSTFSFLLFQSGLLHFDKKEKPHKVAIKHEVEKKEKSLPTTILPKLLANDALMDIQKRVSPKVNIMVSNANDSIQRMTMPIAPIQVEEPVVEIPLFNKVKIEVSEPVVKQKMHLDIIEDESLSAYQAVERRFKNSKDVDDALFLAKYYYGKHKYKKANYWALEANKIDETLEEGLFIFIKSKYKLGHKNEAISILMAYLKKSNSSEAKKLLYNIKKKKL